MSLFARVLVAALSARAFTNYFVSESYPEVNLPQGDLKGVELHSRLGRRFYAFQGIPYAEPPVGPLRFRPPQEAPRWDGVRWAWREGNDCPQIHPTLGEFTGHEDCLYLNVYTPKLTGSDLSVMVWIHGGSFNYGSGSSEIYGPQQLLDQDIVLVTFNYRLGALGFLSLGTPEVSGNYGMKDQVAVLNWVRDNIAKFGGNPDLVTIFGESAGATAVHFLMLSPLAKGLFHRAIAQSGSVFNPWSRGREPEQLAQSMTSALGCQQENVVHCLRSASARNLVQLEERIRGERYWKRMYQPSLEPPGTTDAFLTEHPETLMARGDVSNVPLMAGVTVNEGLQEYQYLGNRSMLQGVKDSVGTCIELIRSLQRSSPPWQAVWSLVERSYNRRTRGQLLDEYIMLNTDCEYVLGVDNLVRQIASMGRSPVFYYLFSYDGNLGTLKRLTRVNRPGTVHTDDLGYLFPKLLLPPLLFARSRDHLTIDRVTKMWADFARTGNPTPDASVGVTWDPVVTNNQEPNTVVTRHLDIGDRLVMKPTSLNAERVRFWHKLLDQDSTYVTLER
ncbi:hypothetical protein B566_EDAN014099 [Ephemera danica]|nr:hypothetical protein B566_EDAN014099 [Ephemera danica]